ncbi:MAG TPA: chlorite dismutase family protein [Candidatus Limnocylindrales bacterium]
MSRPYIHALALGLDPAWRRLPGDERARTGAAFAEALAADAADDVATFTYSSIGLEAGVDLVLWRLGPSLDALEEAAARVLRAGLGPWLTVRQSLLGIVNPSQYVAKPSEQEQSLFEGERSRYLIVYPFTKSSEWYLTGRETRQGIMNEHMRVGRGFPQVRQLLAYSFGLDDQDFVVAYETDELPAFEELVRALRSTEGRRSTVKDSPILAAIHRPIGEILRLLGGVEADRAASVDGPAAVDASAAADRPTPTRPLEGIPA